MPQVLQVFSICSANYMPLAMTLYHSLTEADPDVQFTLFLADDAQAGTELPDVPFKVVRARDLNIPHVADMAFRYTIMEFNTAIKPFCFQWLAEHHGHDPIVYLDPDILVLAPFEELRRCFSAGAELILTPHALEPLDDGYDPDDRRIMQTGAYNLGFAALRTSPEVDVLLDWWAGHMRTRCVSDLPGGLFVDQKFMDMAPAFVSRTEILRHRGYNVAFWNLHERSVGKTTSGEWQAGGDPLVFFHFSGVDRNDDSVFSRHQNRFSAAGVGEAVHLLRRYQSALKTHDDEAWSSIPYAYGTYDDGSVISDLDRFVYRRVHAETTSSSWELFARRNNGMMEAPSEGIADHSQVRITRHMHEFWRQRNDLREAFNLKNAEGRKKYADWFHRYRQAEQDSAEKDHDQGDPVSPDTVDANLPQAVNVVGYSSAASGLGSGVRMQKSVFAAAGVPVGARPVFSSHLSHNLQQAEERAIDARVLYLHVNADQTQQTLNDLKDSEKVGRYKIGYWAWELPRFPDEWAPAIDGLDEIWTPSQFVSEAVARSTDKPVFAIPHAVLPPQGNRERGRAALGLTGDITLISTLFDTRSFLRRKNPLGALNAFRDAFPDPQATGVRLVLKGHGPLDDSRARQLYAQAAATPGVITRHELMEDNALQDLMSATDILLSCHRSEGFGLNIAEAMAAGKVAVATGWSGNMEFMNADNSVLLDYELRPLAPGDYPQAEGQHWAEPSHEQMVEELRALVADPGRRQRIGEKAARHMAERFSVEAMANKVQSRMKQIFAMTSA